MSATPEQAAAAAASPVVSLTVDQLNELVAGAIAKALAAREPLVARQGRARLDRLVPRTVVQPKDDAHERRLEAGIVEAEELDEFGSQVSVTVKFDRDGALVQFAPSELTVLKAHG